jgi:hypothetical protein
MLVGAMLAGGRAWAPGWFVADVFISTLSIVIVALIETAKSNGCYYLFSRVRVRFAGREVGSHIPPNWSA